MRFRKIWLDLDGLLGDFHTAALAAHGLPHTAATWPEPGKDLQQVLGLKGVEGWLDKFWQPINAKPDFWESIQPFPWVHELIDLAKQHAGSHGVAVLTGPASGTETERKAKMNWLAEQRVHLEVKFEKQKGKLAQPNTLLIDDWEHQVKAFTDGGGEAWLVPQPWNELHQYAADPMGYLRDRFSQLTK